MQTTWHSPPCNLGWKVTGRDGGLIQEAGVSLHPFCWLDAEALAPERWRAVKCGSQGVWLLGRRGPYEGAGER